MGYVDRPVSVAFGFSTTLGGQCPTDLEKD
jgi:hypothetical protein